MRSDRVFVEQNGGGRHGSKVSAAGHAGHNNHHGHHGTHPSGYPSGGGSHGSSLQHSVDSNGVVFEVIRLPVIFVLGE